MTDPLSITTGVAGLLSLAGSVISQCYQYGCGVADAPEEAKRLAFEVTNLSGLLVGVQNLAKHHQFPTQDIQPILKECDTSLQTLSSRLRDHGPHPNNKASTTRRTIKRLLWPLRKTDTENLIALLERHKRSLSLALDTFSASNHTNHQRQQILDWLSDYQHEAQYRQGFQLHCSKTCLWLLEDPEFIKWSQRRSSLLWMHGPAGSGKTVATSYLIHHLTHHLSAEGHLLAYFYYDASTIESLTPETFFGACIKQFCSQLPEIPDNIRDAYKRAADRLGTPRQASLNELQNFLTRLLDKARSCIILVDGLDETPDYGVVCDFLTSTITSGHHPLRVFISSRPDVDLRRRLGGFQEILVPETAVEDDIGLYIRSRIGHDTRLRHMSDKMKQKVELSLRVDSHGMFRWVQCQLDAISRLRTDAAIKQALTSLPSSLEGAYTRILRSIPNEDIMYARRALLWLAHASSPLTLPELATVVALEPPSIVLETGHLDPDLALNDPSDVLEICGSLVSYNPISGTTRLAHHSVREFLTQRLDRTSEFHIPPKESHRTMAEICLMYLLLDDFAKGPLFPREFQETCVKYPLLRYAATNWTFHLSMADESSSSRNSSRPKCGSNTTKSWISEKVTTSSSTYYSNDEKGASDLEKNNDTEQVLLPVILRLFTPSSNPRFYFWLQAILSDSRHGYLPPDSDLVRATPLYYAASYGLTETVRALISGLEDNDDDDDDNGGRADFLNTRAGRYGGTALHAAVWRNRPDILKLLLDAGADPTVEDDNGMTPVQLAYWSKKGNTLMDLFPESLRLGDKLGM
ncbi:hypothetical protein LTS17_008142 [Exophiala oligosperma]